MKENVERTLNIIVIMLTIVLSIVSGALYGIGIPVFALVLFYLLFTRNVNNAIIMLLKKKQYVICYLKRSSTRYCDKYYVVPHADKVTDVGGKGSYTLDDKFSCTQQYGRLVFMLIEGDSIPYQFKDDAEMNAFLGIMPYKVLIEFKQRSNDDILFQAKAVHNSLNNRVAEYLFSKKKDMYYIVLGIIAVVAIVALLYAAYVIQQNNALLEYIASQQAEKSIVVK